jgi:hypothetical protein
MATEPSGLPNALLLILATEEREAVREFAGNLPLIDADHRSMLGAARVLLAQIPLGSSAEGPMPAGHVERLEQAIALCALALRQQKSE